MRSKCDCLPFVFEIIRQNAFGQRQDSRQDSLAISQCLYRSPFEMVGLSSKDWGDGTTLTQWTVPLPCSVAVVTQPTAQLAEPP
jgi:hypothetical protein